MNKTMKKLVCLALAASMLLSVMFVLGACKTPEEPFEPVATWSDPDVYITFDGGTITTIGSSGGAEGTVSTTPYAGITGKDYTDEAVYTYNDFLGGTTGLNWNPLSWETNDDSYVLGYQSMGFYDFALNEDLTGYAVVCEMAAALPVDVTADYVGRYGINEGDTAKAWKIALNQNAKWHDGTPINADSYIYSMKEQLDPIALNRRADSFYAGDFQIVNAKAYLYNGKTVANENYDGSDYVFEVADLVEYKYEGANVYIAYGSALNWLSGNSLSAYVGAYGDAYFDVAAYEALVALDTDEDGKVLLTEESLGYLVSTITAVADWGETAEDAKAYLLYDYTYPELEFDEVGLVKTGEYEIVIIANAPVSQPEFYMPYNLSSTWLVHKDIYEAATKYYDAENNEVAKGSADAVSMKTTYCTKLETNASYGPYILTAYQSGVELKFERNNNWYGYSDNNHKGQFQTDNIYVRVIAEHATALQSFIAGDIDGVNLDSDDMTTYGSSDRLRYTPESYTTKLTFNTNYESLLALGNNQQLLAVKEFRKAFAISLDRAHFTSAYTAAAQPGFGLLNYMYVYDPFSGAIYRDSDAAKKALVDLFGLTYGENGDFATLDAAYEAMTGYDITAAKALMQAAYDKAVQAGIYDGKSEVKIDIRVYQSDEIYNKMYTYFDTQLKAACVGTDFEGKVSMTMTVDEDYYETMYAGQAAVIFSTWGGAAMSPFTMINQCYTDASDGSGNQMEYGYKTENINVKINIDGTEYTASLKEWADWCGSMEVAKLADLGRFDSYSYETRCEIFAIVERVYLEGYATTSVYYRNSASLLSKKIETGTDQYLQIIGTGGIRHITYNYTDAEWANVKGTITY